MLSDTSELNVHTYSHEYGRLCSAFNFFFSSLNFSKTNCSTDSHLKFRKRVRMHIWRSQFHITETFRRQASQHSISMTQALNYWARKRDGEREREQANRGKRVDLHLIREALQRQWNESANHNRSNIEG